MQGTEETSVLGFIRFSIIHSVSGGEFPLWIKEVETCPDKNSDITPQKKSDDTLFTPGDCIDCRNKRHHLQ